MDALIAFACLLMFAALRSLPVLVIPNLSPMSWAPGMVRICLMLAFAWLSILSVQNQLDIQWLKNPMNLMMACAAELLIGGLFATAIWIPQAALTMVGQSIDMQAGLGAATLFNPSSNSEPVTILGVVLTMSATVLFFLLDMHIRLFELLNISLQVIPLGSQFPNINTDEFFGMLGSSFVLGLAIGAPVILGLLVADVGIAYATRSMPQANVYFLALPLKAVMAFLLLAITLAFAPTLMGRLYSDALNRVPAVLGG
jgi:flagellar biosynthesis protein FliR